MDKLRVDPPVLENMIVMDAQTGSYLDRFPHDGSKVGHKSTLWINVCTRPHFTDDTSQFA
jgi:hypothetical protein